MTNGRISERDIAILIPTYRYRDKVVRAVESALDSGAGEIIVTDDLSRDGTMEKLVQFRDPRLRVYENERNLGLWENHSRALCYATKPWIKFLQADDYLLPGGLGVYASAVEEGVTVVWGAPTVVDDATNKVSYFHQLRSPRRVSPRELQAACLFAGWILGSPSHFMVRGDALLRDVAAWQTDLSADLVVGMVAASRGDTVLLPHGCLGQGAHAQQDARTQGPAKGLWRMVNSISYLRCRPEPGVREFARRWAVVNFTSAAKNLAFSFCMSSGARSAAMKSFLSLLSAEIMRDIPGLLRDGKILSRALKFRTENGGVVDLDHLFDQTLRGDLLGRGRAV